jgi:hypothetical protein
MTIHGSKIKFGFCSKNHFDAKRKRDLCPKFILAVIWAMQGFLSSLIYFGGIFSIETINLLIILHKTIIMF